jgi:hypothetical protein
MSDPSKLLKKWKCLMIRNTEFLNLLEDRANQEMEQMGDLIRMTTQDLYMLNLKIRDIIEKLEYLEDPIEPTHGQL